jgi:hypothetical protein
VQWADWCAVAARCRKRPALGHLRLSHRQGAAVWYVASPVRRLAAIALTSDETVALARLLAERQRQVPVAYGGDSLPAR